MPASAPHWAPEGRGAQGTQSMVDDKPGRVGPWGRGCCGSRVSANGGKGGPDQRPRFINAWWGGLRTSGLLPLQRDHAKHRCCVVFIPPWARIAQAGVLGGLGVCGECARLA